jgi:hypothetical protein
VVSHPLPVVAVGSIPHIYQRATFLQLGDPHCLAHIRETPSTDAENSIPCSDAIYETPTLVHTGIPQEGGVFSDWGRRKKNEHSPHRCRVSAPGKHTYPGVVSFCDHQIANAPNAAGRALGCPKRATIMALLTTPNWRREGNPQPDRGIGQPFRYNLIGCRYASGEEIQYPPLSDHVGSQSVNSLPVCSGETTKHATGRRPLAASQGS